MKAILEKISPNKNAIRTEGPIVGECNTIPTVGHRFYFYSEPLESKGGVREISTSPVQSFEWVGAEVTGILTFKTLNSIYRLCIKGEKDECR
jgi:hypothetical protein